MCIDRMNQSPYPYPIVEGGLPPGVWLLKPVNELSRKSVVKKLALFQQEGSTFDLNAHWIHVPVETLRYAGGGPVDASKGGKTLTTVISPFLFFLCNMRNKDPFSFAKTGFFAYCGSVLNGQVACATTNTTAILRQQIQELQVQIAGLERDLKMYNDPPSLHKRPRVSMSLAELTENSAREPFQVRSDYATNRSNEQFEDIEEFMTRYRDSLEGSLTYATLHNTKYSTIVNSVVERVLADDPSTKSLPAVTKAIEDGIKNWKHVHTRPGWVVCCINCRHVAYNLQQMYFKNRSRTPDRGYQDGVLGLLELGTGKKSDAGLLLTKNKMKELRFAYTYLVEREFEFNQLPSDVKGIQCRMKKV